MDSEINCLLERVEEFINEKKFQITEYGPLLNPAISVTIERTPKLELDLCIVSSDIEASSCEDDYPKGTIRKNINHAIIDLESGAKVKVNGIQPYSKNNRRNYLLDSYSCEQKSLVSSIEIEFNNGLNSTYTIEHIVNIDKSAYLWPDSLDVSRIKIFNIGFSGDDGKIKISKSSDKQAFSKCMVKFVVGGVNVILGSWPEKVNNNLKNPGFIIYQGRVSDQIRKRIRECISFALGSMLVYLGCSEYSSDWKILRAKAVRGYDINGSAYSIPVVPPVPLSLKYERCIETEKLSEIVDSVYKCYDILSFNHVIWSYWHARCATVHISGVHYGAAIELVISKYVRNPNNGIPKTLIDVESWQNIKDSFLSTLNNYILNAESKKVLINKINSNLNQVPKSKISDDALERLGLKLTVTEKKAWASRNKAAHGLEVYEENAITEIRNANILWTILNRIIIKISNGSSYYIDYGSVNHPIKSL